MKLYKALLVFSLISALLCSYAFTVTIISKREHLKFEDYNEQELNELYTRMCYEEAYYQCELPSYEKIHSDIQKQIKPKLFIEIWLNTKNNGITILQLRLIIIKKGISKNDYCYTLTHEYCHLAYMTEDEALTDLRCVKLLWESNVPYMRYVCATLVKNKISIYLGNKYDCTQRLIEYFKNN